MPTINVTVAKLSKDQKKDLIKSFTEVSMRITGAPEQAHTVLIHELDDDSMGIGTKTVEEFKKEMINK